MAEALDELVDSLLYEGYALYPYTPGATKNATPTPFGIVYPPAYAAGSSHTFDHLELRCVLRGPADAVLHAWVSFLVAAGERHEAVAHRLALPPVALGALAEVPAQLSMPVPASGPQPLQVQLRLEACLEEQETYEVLLRVKNLTPCPDGLDRAGALRHSLISTHPLLRTAAGRFDSPLDCTCASVNTFPVLAGDADDAVLGAAIVLPDHPRIAPESRGGLFDSTEIEEALLLHVRTLSQSEREEIARHDPAVAEMVARAAAVTPREIIDLHGRVTLSDLPRAPGNAGGPPVFSDPLAVLRDGTVPRRDPETTEPPPEPAGLADPSAGEERADVAGVTLRRGAQVRIRPAPDADLHARLLDGRTATIERIFTDFDGRTHLGVTIDDDPGQELMRETSRFLFFFADEVEAVAP